MTIKKALTLDAVIDKNEKSLQKQNVKIATETISKKGNKLRRNNWNPFLDDLMFLKHLGSISCIDT